MTLSRMGSVCCGPAAERVLNHLRMAGNDPKQDPGGSFGFLSALLPVAQGANGNLESLGKLFLRQVELPPDHPGVHHATHPGEFLVGHGRVVGIGHGVRLDFFL